MIFQVGDEVRRNPDFAIECRRSADEVGVVSELGEDCVYVTWDYSPFQPYFRLDNLILITPLTEEDVL